MRVAHRLGRGDVIAVVRGADGTGTEIRIQEGEPPGLTLMNWLLENGALSPDDALVSMKPFFSVYDPIEGDGDMWRPHSGIVARYAVVGTRGGWTTFVHGDKGSSAIDSIIRAFVKDMRRLRRWGDLDTTTGRSDRSHCTPGRAVTTSKGR